MPADKSRVHATFRPLLSLFPRSPGFAGMTARFHDVPLLRRWAPRRLAPQPLRFFHRFNLSRCRARAHKEVILRLRFICHKVYAGFTSPRAVDENRQVRPATEYQTRGFSNRRRVPRDDSKKGGERKQ